MKKGFTLAEVLITLGVIGVVAALTVPNVLQSHQKKVWVTQLQKAYNQVSNAAVQYLSENELSKEALIDGRASFAISSATILVILLSLTKAITDLISSFSSVIDARYFKVSLSVVGLPVFLEICSGIPNS